MVTKPFAKATSSTKSSVALILVAVFMLGCTAAVWAQVRASMGTASATVPAPPKTRIEPVTETLHGTEIVDNYRWLEDQKSPETRAWIDTQNAYTQSLVGNLPGRDTLKKRLEELLKIDSVAFPTEANGRYFFSKRKAGQDLSVIYLRKGLKGADEVLIDPHTMSADHSVSVSLADISTDGKLIAYNIRQGGEDETRVKFMDVDTKKDLSDDFPRARYFGISMLPDKSGLYYTRHSTEGSRVFFHKMGTDMSADKKIFGDGYGPESGIGAGVDDPGHFLVIQVFHGSAAKKVEVFAQDLRKGGPIFPVVSDLDATFSPQIGGDKLYMLTNWKAPNSRIVLVDLANPARDNWKEIVPSGDSPLTGFSLVGGKLLLSYLKDVTSHVRVLTPEGKFIREIQFPVLGNVGGVNGHWDRNEGFFSFTSFHVPTTIYRYDVSSGAQEVFSKLEVPIQADQLEVKQVWFESKDKTKVPMFLVHKKGLKLDGSNPVFLTGYGGFRISLTPSFSSIAVMWAERGGVYAVPSLRGGGEFGEAWHESGMLEKKQNVFDDFISAAEWLIKNKYTSASKLAISGGSNGGLLVGTALTQRPDLFGAVLCSYPLLDMVRYHKFSIARFWVPEYGSSEDAAQFKILKAYSPYHNVKPGTKYPAVMIITGDGDTRVDPLHGRKMAALLQSANGGDRPILIHYDTKAGHSGGTPLNKQIEDLADEYGFLYWQLGVKN
ncbi:MAG: S9 family peptidase [Acidobacteria bacterium]|nr:S9 family peptidase [Acidobacteriota bacterium]